VLARVRLAQWPTKPVVELAAVQATIGLAPNARLARVSIKSLVELANAQATIGMDPNARPTISKAGMVETGVPMEQLVSQLPALAEKLPLFFIWSGLVTLRKLIIQWVALWTSRRRRGDQRCLTTDTTQVLGGATVHQYARHATKHVKLVRGPSQQSVVHAAWAGTSTRVQKSARLAPLTKPLVASVQATVGMAPHAA